MAALRALTLSTTLCVIGIHAFAENTQNSDVVASKTETFLIPGVPGGGWDTTCHAFVELFVDAGFDDVQFEAPGATFAALTSGEVAAIATDFTRANALAHQGAVRIIGLTADNTADLPQGVTSLHDRGIDFAFMTCSGFFAPPQAGGALLDQHVATLQTALDVPE